MKDAVGGALLLHLMAFFMVVYIAFMTAMLMYVQVYKAKNSAIEYIENTREDLSACDLATYMSEHGLSPGGKFFITKHENSNLGKNYYTVGLLLEIAILPDMAPLALRIPIIGETKLIPEEINIEDTSGNYVVAKTLCYSGG